MCFGAALSESLLKISVGFLQEAVDGDAEIDDRVEDPVFDASLGFFR